MAAKVPRPIYQFYSELEDFKPKIWRRFQVPRDITVAKLGYIVMVMYEMMACHLLVFEHERLTYTKTGKLSKRTELIQRLDIPDEDGGFGNFAFGDEVDATKTKLSKLGLDSQSRLVVLYDMGDDWRVSLTLEETITKHDLQAKDLPHVLEGKGFGIVEDCGGVYGLDNLNRAFKAKSGQEYEDYRNWLGKDDFDLDAFDKDDMNFRLKKLPTVYKRIYEQNQFPAQIYIDLIERKYLDKY